MLACIYYHSDSIILFIEKGAYLNIKDDDRYTVLMWACIMNNIEVIKLLKKLGAK